jgi:integrating conjugative element protein (TIGR03752 family)
MAINKSTGLLKWLAAGIAVVLVLAIVKVVNNGKVEKKTQEVVEAPVLSQEEMDLLGIQGDTPQDTVATLVGQVKAMRTEMKTAQAANEELLKENKRLRAREREIDSRIASGLAGERAKIKGDREEVERAKKEARSLLDKFRSAYENRMPGSKDDKELPVGFGLKEGEGSNFASGGDSMVWIDPSDQLQADSKASGSSSSAKGEGYSFPTSFGDAVDSTQAKLNTGVARTPGGSKKKEVRPVYTVPQNSTLMGSTAMTALIGRVPIDGTVNDPYPFKVIVGADNLTANGIDLPEVAGAVVSGTATGDWTLSCVRGQVRSITFVFNDGTVRTLPTPEDAAQAKSGSNQSKGRQLDQIQGGLGWISDPYGIPCIAGERKSNAKQYIGTQSLVTAAGAGVATLLGNQDKSKSGTAVFGSSGSGQFASSTVTGNQAMQQILSSGVSDISDWVNKLYGEAFAAIYVQPNAKVAIHIDQELQIDYEIKGRKVRYAMGATHASTLD